jgi:hypothetical protein
LLHANGHEMDVIFYMKAYWNELWTKGKYKFEKVFQLNEETKILSNKNFFGDENHCFLLGKKSLKNGDMIMKNIDPQKPLFIVQRDGVHCP